MEARGSGGNDPFYQNYLKRFATWGQVRRNVRFQTKHAMISPSGYIKIPIFIEGTDEQVASCQIKYSDGALELSQMFVEDGYRGRGLTYLLALAACVYARNHLGAPPDTTVWLEANSMSAMDNSTLVGIYERWRIRQGGQDGVGPSSPDGSPELDRGHLWLRRRFEEHPGRLKGEEGARDLPSPLEEREGFRVLLAIGLIS